MWNALRNLFIDEHKWDYRWVKRMNSSQVPYYSLILQLRHLDYPRFVEIELTQDQRASMVQAFPELRDAWF